MEQLTATNINNSFNGPSSIYETTINKCCNFTIKNLKVQTKEKEIKAEKK